MELYIIVKIIDYKKKPKTCKLCTYSDDKNNNLIQFTL